MLNLCINDLMNQFNKTVKVLLDENQKLTAEIQQLKGADNIKAEKKTRRTIKCAYHLSNAFFCFFIARGKRVNCVIYGIL